MSQSDVIINVASQAWLFGCETGALRRIMMNYFWECFEIHGKMVYHVESRNLQVQPRKEPPCELPVRGLIANSDSLMISIIGPPVWRYDPLATFSNSRLQSHDTLNLIWIKNTRPSGIAELLDGGREWYSKAFYQKWINVLWPHDPWILALICQLTFDTI